MVDILDTSSEYSETDLMVEKAIREGSHEAPEEVEVIDPEEASLDDDARKSRWQSRRPNIDHLKDGVVTLPDGTPLPVFVEGDRIVVDIRTQHLKGIPWLETLVGIVGNIDDDTGVVTLLDEEADPRVPRRRYVSFKDGMHIFKLANARGNPFDASKAKVIVKAPLLPGEKKRGRGRPAGAKNRPKEVILAEKEARKAAKAAKKGRVL